MSIANNIWDMKYRLKDAYGKPIDQDVEGTWTRVAKALAVVEDDGWEQKFFEAMEGYKFIPAGRIIAGAGTGRRVTLSNCFTMGTIPDSMRGIFESLKEAAMTMQQGGGIGYDFSTLRPKGALVVGVSSDASGPLSFMDVWDAMCRTIMSAGSRRGAMMATMRCDHPDIEDFITAKQDASRLRMFNLSVLITDAFMAAVEADDKWHLTFNNETYKTISARELWDLIMRSTYDYAEPGVIFIDRVNSDHNLRYIETIATTNPCGEKPMGPYASCILGSINLAAFVREPFTGRAYLNVDELKHHVAIAVRMLDNAITVGNFPLQQQKAKAYDDRQIGLGITGLADALAMFEEHYGSEQARSRAANWARIINETAYLTSSLLAHEKGSFRTFDPDKYLDGTHASKLPEDIQAHIRNYGMRNALVTSIAPTGTISLFAGNVSSGIEPIFATSYTRKVLQKDGSSIEEDVKDYAVELYNKKYRFDPDEDYFVTAQELDPIDHVRMQAAIQPHVDSSISKTINVPKDISFEAFKDVYMEAYMSGCKGCTTYRPNDVTGSVLSVSSAEKPAEEPAEEPDKLEPRPGDLTGTTYKLKWPESAHALYITINDIDDEQGYRPFEIFINSKNMEHYAWTVALTRMISAVFRRGGDIAFVAEELKAVFDPRGGAWMKGKYVPSMLAAIGDVIERHLSNFGVEIAVVPDVSTPCPDCGSSNVSMSGGCQTCMDCGWSKC